MKKRQSNDIQTIEDVRQRQVALRRIMQIQKEAMVYGIHDISENIKPGQVALDFISTTVGGLFQRPSISQLAVNALVGRALVGNAAKNQQREQVLGWATPIMLSVLPKATEYLHGKLQHSELVHKAQSFLKKIIEKIKNRN